MGVDQLRIARKGERHRVDREVAAGQVLRQGGGPDLGQGAGGRVGLAAGRGQVELELVGADPRGREALVRVDLAAQAPAELGGVALHDEVEVGSLPPEEEVAHRAAHQIHGRAGRGPAHAVEARERAQALGKPLRVDSGSLSRFKGPFWSVPYHDDPRGWVVCWTSGAPGASPAGLRSWAGSSRSSPGRRSPPTWSRGARPTSRTRPPPSTSRSAPRRSPRRSTGRCTATTRRAPATSR